MMQPQPMPEPQPHQKRKTFRPPNSEPEYESLLNTESQPVYRLLVHVEPATLQRTPEHFSALLDPLSRTGHALLPFAHVITSQLSGAAVARQLLSQHVLASSDRLVVMPLTNLPWFAHGAPSAESLDTSSEIPSAEPSRERKLAILILPADPRRFDEDFGRLLRVVAPYDCEVSRFLRVIKTSMSVKQCGQRLLQDRILLPEDRFFVMEMSGQPWFAHNATSMSDCERI